nr:reverse transcriptase domain, reverse transcriptase zinc-binding domain protein [Tanacetum cinerariifolium]
MHKYVQVEPQVDAHNKNSDDDNVDVDGIGNNNLNVDGVSDDRVDVDNTNVDGVDDTDIHVGDVNVDSDDIDDTNCENMDGDDDFIGEINVDKVDIFDPRNWDSLTSDMIKDLVARGDSPFYIRYNRLYRLEREKYCLIIDCIDNGQWRWNWSRSILKARNSADLLDMLFEISYAEINEVEDTCVWSLGTDGTFSVKDARCIIDSKILSSLAPSTVWDKTIPRKVNIWRLILDRLPHKLNLSSRSIDIQAIYCPSCNGNMESSNHIFFECNIAKDI